MPKAFANLKEQFEKVAAQTNGDAEKLLAAILQHRLSDLEERKAIVSAYIHRQADGTGNVSVPQALEMQIALYNRAHVSPVAESFPNDGDAILKNAFARTINNGLAQVRNAKYTGWNTSDGLDALLKILTRQDAVVAHLLPETVKQDMVDCAADLLANIVSGTYESDEVPKFRTAAQKILDSVPKVTVAQANAAAQDAVAAPPADTSAKKPIHFKIVQDPSG